ncbi:MAG: hypothetical protein V2B20_13450 [Pseudomonadota bacterium]
MAYWIKVQDGKVVQVWDTPPPVGETGWRNAIEIRPEIDENTQRYGVHSFDLTKEPAEIVWAVINMTAQEIADTTRIKEEQKYQRYTEAVQKRLDDFAKTRGYDNIMSACSYAVSTNEKYASEGKCCIELRDRTWESCYSIISTATPTVEELIASLPELAWR